MAGVTTFTSGTAQARGFNAFLTARPITLGVFRLLSTTLSIASATPLPVLDHYSHSSFEEGMSMWVLYVASVTLVLLGGAFAGLTIA
jgi:metal transporter CNNM